MYLQQLLKSLFVLAFALCFYTTETNAQMPVFEHPRRAEKRNEIDAKRSGTNFFSKDALPRSREFKRIDSTYYVGWMYEGMYKSEMAMDFLGYRNAITPLKKALELIEKDYAKALRVRSADFLEYYPVYTFQFDYSAITSRLVECYNNTDQPNEAYEVIRKARKWNFQREFFMQSYNSLAWLVHRNRFYTSDKYPFLKNSIAENEELSNKYLDSALRKIRIDKKFNDVFFQPGYDEFEKLSVYHYKAMLYSYALQLDSANKYYNLQKNKPYFSDNNYATFKSISGEFRIAEQHYKKASENDGGDRRLQEWAYYSSILNIYKAQPHTAVASMKDMIKAVGSTPGFGWYNIALARACTYNGETEASEKYIQKAEGFKEVHIGTTLGQSHYDFSVNLVKLHNIEQHYQSTKFENENWWYNPMALGKLAGQASTKLGLQYLIVNQFANNPERDLVIYRLFSTESTVMWDEIWLLIRDFSTNFFLQKYQQLIDTDKRPLLVRYFKLNTARLLLEKGKYDDAYKILLDITNDKTTDLEYERLFSARMYEALALYAEEKKLKEDYDRYAYNMYLAFPQLLPFSDIKPNLRLEISGNEDKELIKRLKKCNFNKVRNNSLAPIATIRTETKDGKKLVHYSVRSDEGKILIPTQSFYYTDAEKAGVALAYKLFGVGMKVESKEE